MGLTLYPYNNNQWAYIQLYPSCRGSYSG
jgi:hypothetical protein